MQGQPPRIPPLDEAEWSDETRQLLSAVTPPDGSPFNIFKTIVRHPGLYRRWMAFGGHILRHNSLTPRERELLILRTGHRCKSAYEFHQHRRIGMAAGLGADEIDRVREDDLASWPEREALLLQAADELHQDKTLTDATWNALAQRYTVEQLLDLIFTVGQYTLVSMALNSLRVQIEDEEQRP